MNHPIRIVIGFDVQTDDLKTALSTVENSVGKAAKATTGIVSYETVECFDNEGFDIDINEVEKVHRELLKEKPATVREVIVVETDSVRFNFDPDMLATPILTATNDQDIRFVLAVRHHKYHPYCVWRVDERGKCEWGHYLGDYTEALECFHERIAYPPECCVQPPAFPA